VRSAEPDAAGGPAGRGFRQTAEEVVHRGRLLTVVKAHFVDPEGTPFERDVVRHPGAVAVVAVTDDASVVLVRQFRAAIGRAILEIPAGTRDVDGEPEEDTARRELAEESGYAAGELTLLTRCVITPGFCDEFASIFLATGLRKVPTEPHGIEERYLSVVEVPLDDFDVMVDEGAVVDAQTILGVGLARRRLVGSPSARG
jgi:8-oxo-dGTP pyrophosphatase MutT (NUDIX family)